MKHISLRAKASVLLLVCILFPLLVFSVVNYRLTYNHLRENLVTAAQNDTEKIAYYFMMEMSEYFNLAYYVASDTGTQASIDRYLAGESSQDTLLAQLQESISGSQLQSRVKYPFEYLMVLPDGSAVTRHSHSGRVAHYATAVQAIKTADWYDTLLDNISTAPHVFQHEDYINANGGDKIYIARRVETAGGDAVFLVGINRLAMDRLLDNYRPTESSSIFIYAGEDFVAQGEQNPINRARAGTIAGSNSPFAAFRDKDNGEMLYNQQVFYFTDLPKLPWYVYVVTPTQTILQSIQYIRYTTYILAAICIGIVLLLLALSQRYIFYPINRLNRAMADVAMGDTTPRLPGGEDEIGALYSGFNSMAGSIEANQQRAEREARERMSLELAMLQSQITPHFMRNTLNSIRWMAEILKADGIARAVLTLTKLLDYNIREFPDGVTLDDELANLQEYIYIQRLRFGNKFTYATNVPEELMGAKTLKLLLQPLVENSITHGFLNISHMGHIVVRAEKDVKTGDLLLHVEDNGTGMRVETQRTLLTKNPEKKGSHIGVYNVHKRIEASYGPGYGLTIAEAPGGGTHLTIRIPFEEARTCE